MKRSVATFLTALALTLPALILTAQDADTPPPPRGPRPPQDGAGGPGGPSHHPLPPLMAALDANHDGVIDADEIANAPAALRKLDKNGDGKLTRDELRPARANGEGGKKGKNKNK